jgi:hypothetical protein
MLLPLSLCYSSLVYPDEEEDEEDDDEEEEEEEEEEDDDDDADDDDDLKVGCLHPVACTRSGSGFPSNATLV